MLHIYNVSFGSFIREICWFAIYCCIIISVGCSSILPLTIEGIAWLCSFIDCLILYSITVYTSRAILIIKSRASILDVFCRYSAYTKKLGFLRHFQFFQSQSYACRQSEVLPLSSLF